MKYLLALYGEEGGWDDVTPEEMKEGMEPWSEYGRQVTEAGVFVAGEGFAPGSRATASSRRTANCGRPMGRWSPSRASSRC